MAEPKQPELEAVAWLNPAHYGQRVEPYVGQGPPHPTSVLLCSLPSAGDLLAIRDERIAELEAKLARLESAHQEAAELAFGMQAQAQADLERWRPIVRAALSFLGTLDSEDAVEIYSLDTQVAIDELSSWVDVLSEEECSEILKPEGEER